MRPTSDAQVAATAAGRAAPMEQVREGIWAIAQPFPAVVELFTLNYVIEDARGDLHLIDPGADDDENFEALAGQLDTIGHSIDDIATVTVTHLHDDHLGLAPKVRAASGARILLHPLEQAAIDTDAPPAWTDPDVVASWGVPGASATELLALERRSAGPRVRADGLVEHGELLDVPGRWLRVIHTPGHTVGHICIEGEELLFTGDHVLPNQVAGIGLGGDRGTNPLRDLHDSIALVAPLDHLEVCPGHGWRFSGLAERCEQVLEHHGRRTREVAAVLAAEPGATVWQIAERLTWSAGWERLTGFRLGSALAQAAMHRDYVLAG